MTRMFLFPNRVSRRRAVTAVALAACVCAPFLASCGGDVRATSTASALGDTVGAARRVAVIERSATPYRVEPVTGAGSVTGTVVFDGVPKEDTVIQIAADQNGCGKPLTIQRLQRRNGKLAGAVVWLTDVRAGAGFPLERRYELENNDCAWDPVVQTAVAGGGLNVVNSDPLVERAYALDVATGDTAAVAPFTDDGEIVPYDRMLRTPGVYEFSVESRPMSRAWVAVFDHPYFAMTKDDGSFALDNVPAGTHKLRAWHPMLGMVDGTVTVTAGGKATAELRFR